MKSINDPTFVKANNGWFFTGFAIDKRKRLFIFHMPKAAGY
jgi:hypothetical protein